MLILYKNARNVRFVLFTKTSKVSPGDSLDASMWERAQGESRCEEDVFACPLLLTADSFNEFD